MMTDAERLARFERFAADARTELDETRGRMEALRATGRVKSATYRQLFANRLELEHLDARLRDLGL